MKENPAAVAYAISTILLCINLLFLWAFSGATRAKTKTTLNDEDGKAFHAAVVALDPPPVARVLRAHQNAMAAFVPFAALALVYVLFGATPLPARVLFFAFVAARWAHSIMYLRGLQPWRTICFTLGLLIQAAIIVAIILRLAA